MAYYHLRTLRRHEGHGVRGRLPGGLHPSRGRTSRSSPAEMLYIHPDECIDCGACVPACPVEAIFSLDETPRQVERSSSRKNARVLSDE